MNVKKIAIAGVVALVVVGCVLAAGCTSTQTTTPTQTTADPILGVWGDIEFGDERGIHAVTFLADGSGTEKITSITGKEENYPFTWKKTGGKIYQLNYQDKEIWDVTYTDPETPLIWKNVKSSSSDGFVGTHTSSYKNSDGKTIEYKSVYKDDNTGVITATYEDKTTKEFNVTWRKVDADRYYVESDDNVRWEVTSTAKELTYKKIDYSNEPIVGETTEEFNRDGKKYSIRTVIKGNGAGTEIWTLPSGEKENYPFVWKKTAEYTYLVSYIDSLPFEQWIITYNPSDKSQDWDLHTILWADNGAGTSGHVTENHYYNGETGEGIVVEYNADGTSKTYKTKWEGDNYGSFTITYDDGDVWKATWNPVTEKFDWEQLKK